jgi:hypothetical protein
MENISVASTEPVDRNFSALLYTIVLHSTVFAGYFAQNVG